MPVFCKQMQCQGQAFLLTVIPRKSTSRMQGHYKRSVKDKPFYCQSSVSKRPSAATFELYGNGLSVYKLPQSVLSLSLFFFFSSHPSHPPQHYIWLIFSCLFETTIAATKGRLQHVKGSHFRVYFPEVLTLPLHPRQLHGGCVVVGKGSALSIR